MKPKNIEWMLSEIDGFENPKVNLEQYATSAELAVAIVQCISSKVDLQNALIADLGCGCGMLSAALALIEPSCHLVGVDIDSSALAICQNNVQFLEIHDRCSLINADVTSVGRTLAANFDVIIMNPPFGTKSSPGIDMQFVQSGLSILRDGGSVFSLHKTATREYILKTANKWENTEAACLANLRWNLPATYRFHKKKNVDIEVDLIQFQRKTPISDQLQ